MSAVRYIFDRRKSPKKFLSKNVKIMLTYVILDDRITHVAETVTRTLSVKWHYGEVPKRS